MGHQHHFLSRLDRVSLPHVERALALYRDHDLVRYLLGRLSIPDEAERVAISLDHPERGPFLIVTREGRFVTCLGEGMGPGRLPIVTRERLDGISAKVDDLRARRAARAAIEGRGSRDLLLALYHGGEDLSREEIFAASSLAPLLRTEILRLIGEAGNALDEVADTILHVLRRTDKPGPQWRSTLEGYYKTHWMAVHLTAIVAAEAREVLERMTDEKRRRLRTVLSSPPFQHAHVAPAARAIWAVGKIGRCLVPNYKAAYAAAGSVMALFESALCLSELGLRHVRSRAEVRKALSVLPAGLSPPAASPALHGFTKKIVGLCDHAFDRPEDAVAAHRAWGAELAVAQTRRFPPGHPHRYEREEDVPAALAFALVVTAGSASSAIRRRSSRCSSRSRGSRGPGWRICTCPTISSRRSARRGSPARRWSCSARRPTYGNRSRRRGPGGRRAMVRAHAGAARNTSGAAPMDRRSRPDPGPGPGLLP